MTSDESVYRWSEQEYTLRELYDAGVFPVLVLVTSGYLGDAPWETISADDILWVNGRGTQKRVIASDLTSARPRSLSIPADYPVPFRKLRHQQQQQGRSRLGLLKKISFRGLRRPNQPRQLAQLVQQEQLPCSVQLALESGGCLRMGVGSEQLPVGADRLELQDVYEERFLKANAIFKSELDPNLQALPVYLGEVLVVKAVGLASPRATAGQWQRLARYYSASSRAFNFDGVVPSKDILIYDQEIYDSHKTRSAVGQEDSSEENIYDTIAPSNYALLSNYTRLLPNEQPGPSSAAASSTSPSSSKGPEPPPPRSSPELRPSSDYEDVSYVMVSPNAIRTLKDIPKDIRELNREALAKCLQLLNMGRYAEVFHAQQVDGKLLHALDEEMMKRDLGVSAIDARKLYMFAQEGWRPSV